MGFRIRKKQNGILKPHMIKLPGRDEMVNFNIIKMVTTKERRKELCNMKKGMIIAFFYVYQVYTTVVTLVKCSWFPVKGFLTWYYLRGKIDNLQRSGRPEVLP